MTSKKSPAKMSVLSIFSWPVIDEVLHTLGISLLTMPAKMMSEMPLPSPYSEINSPNHINIYVPATMVAMKDMNSRNGTWPFAAVWTKLLFLRR